MSDLERDLQLLAREVEWPAQPDLAPRVRARLDAPERRRAAARPDPRAARARVPRRLLVVLAAMLVLLAALMAAVPSARDSVLDFIGLDGATVEVRDELPGGEVARELRLGPPVTLAAAREGAAFHVLVPAALGDPRSVHLRRDPPGGEVTLAYGPPARPLIVTQFRGDLAPEYAGKIVGPDARIRRLPGGLYIEGSPHFFFYRTPDGAVRQRSLRLARDVLLLERSSLLVRIEGAGSLRRARRIAASLR